MIPLMADIFVGGGIINLLIYVIVIGAVIGIVYVALQQFGVAIPAWATKIFWIVVVAFVAIFAIKLILSM